MIVDGAAEPVRGNARYVLAIVELSPHEVVLRIDAPHAIPDGCHIVLGDELGTVKLCVALLEQHLVEFFPARNRRWALGESSSASDAGELPIDEAAKARVVGGDIEAERPRCLLQSGFDRRSFLFVEEGIADLEGSSCLVHAL